MITPDGRVVVVGGGLGAARIVPALRRKGLTGPIEVVSAEVHHPYDRPPLSKDVLSGRRDDSPLPFDAEKFRVDFRGGCTATGLDPRARILHTDRGGISYDGLVIATGGNPIRVPGPGDQVTLRTVDDALRLRARMVPGAKVVIIGASWIGAEVATAARDRGCEVSCVELAEAPLVGALGPEVARQLLPWWDGIDLRCGTAVREVVDEGVVLADGSLVPADVVVTGVGIRPAVQWLAGSGLEIDRGVLTDDRCRTSAADVVAIGDAAQRWSPRSGNHVLVEHWDDAGSAAMTAAQALLTEEPPAFDPVPYFWSDQFGRKLQYVGAHGPQDRVSTTLDAEGSLTTATWTAPDGTLTAWLGVDRPKDVVAARTAVGHPAADLART